MCCSNMNILKRLFTSEPRQVLSPCLDVVSQRCFSLTIPAALNLKHPKNYDHVKYPDRRRLKIIDKVPPIDPGIRPPKMMKDLHLMRGPELVHNKLQYGDYGIQAVTGGRITQKDTETVRMIIVRQMDERNMFAIWRFNQLWQSITKKGQGRRMGGGKGAIDHYALPFKAERILMEMGGHCEFVEVYPVLQAIRKALPFRTRVVSHERLEKREEKAKWVADNNINPFTFEYCARNNILGCQKILNRYDNMWYGKYR